MKLIRTASIVLTVFLWASSVPAQETGSLSLQDCIAIALKNQSDILVGQNTVISAREREVRTRSDYYPQIAIETSSSATDSGRHNDDTSLTVSQNFYDGGLREAQARGARAALTQDTFALERIRQTVVFNVTRDYLDLLRSQKLAEVQDASVKYLEEQLAYTKGHIEGGDIAPVNEFPIGAQLANARVDQLAARSSIRTASVQLQQTMGLTPQADFSIQEVAEPKAVEIRPMENYTAIALANRPEVPQVGAGVTSAQASLQTAKISLSPRPAVTGQYDRSLSGGGSLSSGDSRDDLTIAASLTFDLFNGGSNRAAYKEARADLSSAEIRAAQTEKDIRAEVQEAYSNLNSAKDRLAASDLSLEAAQKNSNAQDKGYQLGAAITLDILNALSQLVTAQSSAVQSRYDYYTYIAQLEYAVGRQGVLYGE